MGSHQNSTIKTNDWLTPPFVIEALGPFDLDPCAAPEPRPWSTAVRHLVREDDGLSMPWQDRVWLNPPYGREAAAWLEKLAEHGNGVALMFARTETDMFFRWVWDRADAVLFLRGRLRFHHLNGRRAKHTGGAPSCLAAYGQSNARALMNCGLKGHYVPLREG